MQTVRWMSGLVYGLQNRPRRFESATHLESLQFTLRTFCFFIAQSRRDTQSQNNYLEQIYNLCEILCVTLRLCASLFGIEEVADFGYLIIVEPFG